MVVADYSQTSESELRMASRFDASQMDGGV